MITTSGILKALAICNKLKPSKTKARHASRLFVMLNKSRVKGV